MSSAPGLSARERFRVDLRRYDPEGRCRGLRGALKLLLQNEALWAIGTYRLGQYLREEASPALQRAARIPYGLFHRAMGLLVGIHLFPQTQIGPGLYIGHYGGIWISPWARIGAHCNINHETTIGTAHVEGAPQLGDRVWVGPNSTLTGNIRVGSGAVIGANSLVANHLPENAVAIGVPARVVSYSGSAKLVTPWDRPQPGAPQEEAHAAAPPAPTPQPSPGPLPPRNEATGPAPAL